MLTPAITAALAAEDRQILAASSEQPPWLPLVLPSKEKLYNLVYPLDVCAREQPPAAL
jgi:hypothetical protein